MGKRSKKLDKRDFNKALNMITVSADQQASDEFRKRGSCRNRQRFSQRKVCDQTLTATGSYPLDRESIQQSHVEDHENVRMEREIGGRLPARALGIYL